MKVLITGSSGIIGQVLTNGLDHDITPFDLPEHDALDYDDVLRSVGGHDAVVHLAHNTAEDNWRSDDGYGDSTLDNGIMADNILKACTRTQTRLILASSVHADSRYLEHTADQGLLDPYRIPEPRTAYGEAKCVMEVMAKHYANNLGVICVRFGGVALSDDPMEFKESSTASYLSHRDCVSLIDCCIRAERVPNNFAIVYGVSDNAGRVHDISNPIGWVPVDGSSELVNSYVPAEYDSRKPWALNAKRYRQFYGCEPRWPDVVAFPLELAS